MTSAWTALEDRLRDADAHGEFSGDCEHPVNQIVNKARSARCYKEILIAALDEPLHIREREMVVRSLSEKGIVEVIPTLFRYFDSPDRNDSSFLWAAGNAIRAIAPKGFLPETLRVCRDRALGMSRQMLVIHASRFKKDDDVFDMLISLVGDSTVRGHALEALWRYGDPRALATIEATPVTKGLYEAKAKNTAIRRLQRKLESNKRQNKARLDNPLPRPESEIES